MKQRYTARRNTKRELNCVLCNKQYQPNDMINHIQDTHKMDTRQTCPWCLKYTWQRGVNSNQYQLHRLECIDSKLNAIRVDAKSKARARIAEKSAAYKATKTTTNTASSYTSSAAPTPTSNPTFS